jgi:anti-anti-sigma factor
MGELKNYREVGTYDVLNAPLNPIGAFNAEQFKKEVQDLIEQGSRNIVIDLGTLDFLYSDAFNAFMTIQTQLALKQGQFGILTADDDVTKSLEHAGVAGMVHIFRDETELMGHSLNQASRTESKSSEPEHHNESTFESRLNHNQDLSDSFNDESQSDLPFTGTYSPEQYQKQAQSSSEKKSTGRHKFTQSFNSLQNEEDTEEVIDPLPPSKSSGFKTLLLVILLLLIGIAGGAAYYFLTK